MSLENVLGSWRQWIRLVVVVVYIVGLVVAVPLCIWELERKGAPDHVQAWFVGGIFVLMALPISLWGILQHILNYTAPHLQRYIIRILWMVPIYALNAWFALRFPGAAIYLDTLRECYEAYVVYNFMAYLLSFLSHEYPDLDLHIQDKQPVKHIFPLCLLPSCRFTQKFVQRCKHGVLQYTVVRPTMTIIAVITEMVGKYDDGDFNFKTSWSYIVIINNLSQILAMYCLVLFYKAFKEELQPLKPVPKFVCVKAVVFLSFWQAVLIAFLAKLDAIPENGKWEFYKDIKEVATGLQDFVICIEMFLAAIAHYISFSHKPFVNLAAEQRDCCFSFLSMWNVKDVTQDVVEHALYIGRGMKKTLSGGRKLSDQETNEKSHLLSNRSAHLSGHGGSIQLSTFNSQTKEPPSPAVIIYSHNEATEQDFHVAISKPSSDSMINYVNFSLSGELGDNHRQSHVVGGSSRQDTTGLKKHDLKTSQVLVVAEINTHQPQLISYQVNSEADSLSENLTAHSNILVEELKSSGSFEGNKLLETFTENENSKIGMPYYVTVDLGKSQSVENVTENRRQEDFNNKSI